MGLGDGVTTTAPVLVTGASGFLGTHLCARLVERGRPVRALVRDASRAPAGTRAEVADDLNDRLALRRAMEGVSLVVHLAARVHILNDQDPCREETYRRINVDGTRAVVEEAIRAGAECVVFISSVKAVGESTTAAAWTDATPPAPVDAYGRSKLEAERLVRQLADDGGIRAPILRLPLVYGAGMKGNMLRLFRAVDRGVPLPFGAIRNRRSLAYAGNVAAAIEAAAAAPAAARATMFVSDGEDVSTPALVREIAAALGRRPRLLPMPPALFRGAGRIGDIAARVVPFPLTTAAVERLIGSLSVDSTGLRQLTGLQPPFSMRDGLRATAAWYRGMFP